MPKTISDAVNSIVITGRSMNGFESPEENWTSFPPGVFSPATRSRCWRGSPGGADPSPCSAAEIEGSRPFGSSWSFMLVNRVGLRRFLTAAIRTGFPRIHLHAGRQLQLARRDHHLALLDPIGNNGEIALRLAGLHLS